MPSVYSHGPAGLRVHDDIRRGGVQITQVDGISYIVEVVTKSARCEHRFESFENAKRYANDVQRTNPDVGVIMCFATDGWISEYRRDVWQEGIE